MKFALGLTLCTLLAIISCIVYPPDNLALEKTYETGHLAGVIYSQVFGETLGSDSSIEAFGEWFDIPTINGTHLWHDAPVEARCTPYQLGALAGFKDAIAGKL